MCYKTSCAKRFITTGVRATGQRSLRAATFDFWVTGHRHDGGALEASGQNCLAERNIMKIVKHI